MTSRIITRGKDKRALISTLSEVRAELALFYDDLPETLPRMRALLCCKVLVLLIAAGCSPYTSGLTRGQSSVCEPPKLEMLKTNVPITYGLVRLNAWGKALEAARTNTFPHAADEMLGGCIVGDPTNAVVYVCPACLTARSTWEREHPHP